uniref:nuclear receptor coactivator 4-like isoform X1 n=1 Tax=Myxine glutinosa TaxID=7769 RepID=UPI00358EF522
MSKWLEACQVAQRKVSATIADVTEVQKQLRDAGWKTRDCIRCCMSRQQECLRSREIWLLSQVELLEQLKDEALQDQLGELLELSGRFKSLIEQQQAGAQQVKSLADQVSACLLRYTALNLKADVSRDVTFSADVASLRNTIKDFGSVGCTMQTDCCLPTVKHQMQPSSTTTLHKLPFPMPSRNLEDWLHQDSRKLSSRQCAEHVEKDLHVWPKLEKRKDVLVEQDLEQKYHIRSSSIDLSSSMEMLDLSDDFIEFDDLEQGDVEKNVDSCNVLSSFYKDMKLNDWLHRKAKLAPQTTSAIHPHPVKTTDSHSVLPDFYKDMKMTSWLHQGVKSSSQASRGVHFINKYDWRDWLAPPAANLIQSEACAGCPSAFLPTSLEKPVEIENLASLHCIGEKAGNTVSDGEVHHGQLVPSESLLPQVCRANELCGSFSECACDGECKRVALTGWLLRQEGRDKNGVSTSNKMNYEMDVDKAEKSGMHTMDEKGIDNKSLHDEEKMENKGILSHNTLTMKGIYQEASKLRPLLHPAHCDLSHGATSTRDVYPTLNQFRCIMSAPLSEWRHGGQLNQSGVDPVEMVCSKPDLTSLISATKGNDVQKVQQSASDHWLFKKQSRLQNEKEMETLYYTLSQRQPRKDLTKWLLNSKV